MQQAYNAELGEAVFIKKGCYNYIMNANFDEIPSRAADCDNPEWMDWIDGSLLDLGVLAELDE